MARRVLRQLAWYVPAFACLLAAVVVYLELPIQTAGPTECPGCGPIPHNLTEPCPEDCSTSTQSQPNPGAGYLALLGVLLAAWGATGAWLGRRRGLNS